jgi:RNA polymerase sigma-70 factor (ECF subfamily)
MTGNEFDGLRPWMFSIAYRMLGSASDAEDIVQDAWLRFQHIDRASIRSPKAFATRTVTRLCLDRLKSARATREEYLGTWLPEPVLTSEMDGPDTLLQRAESITLAFLVLLEQLSPEQRAVFLLKEVFGQEHAAVAQALGLTVEHSRQLLRRAKGRLAARQPRLTGTAASRRDIAERFARVFAAGDEQALTALLARDVGLWSDGGGKATAARRPLIGRDEVLRLLIGLHRTADTAGYRTDVSLRIEDVNAEPALLVYLAGRLDAVFVFSIAADVVNAIRIVRNPDKLARLGRQLATLH